MYNNNQQQIIDWYMKQCFSLYPLGNKHPYYINTLNIGNTDAITNNTGFMRINIVNQIDKTPVNNATITIYVTDGSNRDIPIMHIITRLNPVRIELPMANELGTKIVGPEYSFSTYDLRVDAFGYLSNNIYNIRLFPNTTSDFEIEMMSIEQLSPQAPIEERTDLPPHLRD